MSAKGLKHSSVAHENTLQDGSGWEGANFLLMEKDYDEEKKKAHNRNKSTCLATALSHDIICELKTGGCSAQPAKITPLIFPDDEECLG